MVGGLHSGLFYSRTRWSVRQAYHDHGPSSLILAYLHHSVSHLIIVRDDVVLFDRLHLRPLTCQPRCCACTFLHTAWSCSPRCLHSGYPTCGHAEPCKPTNPGRLSFCSGWQCARPAAVLASTAKVSDWHMRMFMYPRRF